MKRIQILLFLSLFCFMGFSQQAYFADGYHGGIYGHYPVEWETRFIVDQLLKHPEWKINLEIEPETWDTVKLRTPEDYEDLKKMIADKRIDFTNPTYAQPYCYNISGESIIRQFEYGIRKINQHFPDVKFTVYAVEEPCFTSALPQILKLFGFKYAVLKCPDTCWGGYTQAHGKELVNWIGPDGTSILTVPRYACEKLEENSTWQTIAWTNSDAYLKACFDSGIEHPAGMCYQDAGWKNGPWLGFGDNIKNKSAYVTWTDYIENISVGKTKDNYFLSQEDVLVNLMWGSQVLQKIGQEVRRAENNIIMAEKLGAMAHLENNYAYSQDSVNEAWRTLMLAQHHDSWIVPYNRLKQQRTWAEEITLWTSKTNAVSGDIIKEAVESFDRQNALTDHQGFIRIYNTLGINRKEMVSFLLPQEYTETDFIIYDIKNKEIPFSTEKENGKIKLSFKADVPSFGYATYRIKEGKSKQQNASRIQFSKNNECILENDMYRIVFDASKGGTIKSLVAKKEENKEYVSQTNEYLLGELSGYFYEDEKFYSSKETPAKITILKDNLLEKSILIEGEIATHPFSQIVTIAEGQRRIDFDLTINWKYNVGIGEYKQGPNWRDNRRAFYDSRFKLNVLFPVHLQSPHLYKDAPFDVCESRLDNTFFNTWDGIKHNIILHWVDLSEAKEGYGLALFSDHTTSYAYGDDSPLGLTAQYSGTGLWGVDYKITRPLQMKYAILPHKGKWDEAAVSTENSFWNEPLIGSYSPRLAMENKSWIDVRHTGYEISSAQIANNAILVRLYNAEGDDSLQKVSFGFPVSNVEEVDLNGKPLKSIAIKKTCSGSEMPVAMPRFGLRTFLVKKAEINPADYVNPFIGASTSTEDAGVYHGLGKTFPGATTPYGMVQVSPNTITGGDNSPGYSYEHKTIEGFAFTQMSGVGWYGDFGNFLVMPATGKLQLIAGKEDGSIGGYRSHYNKKTETARTGYYAAELTDYNIQVESSATPHCGILKFTFPKNEQSRIQIDLARRVGGTSTYQYVQVVDDYTIKGWMRCTPDGGGWGNGDGKADYTVHFYARFSKPITNYGFWSADIPDNWKRKLEDVTSLPYLKRVSEAPVIRDRKELEGKHLGFFTEFSTKEKEEITLKVGISFVDMDGAEKNFKEEIADKTFEEVKDSAWKSWNQELSRIRISGGTEDEETVFYTALYHTMIDPRIYTDVDGRYTGGDGKIYNSNGTFTKRTVFSGWDVFRSQYPLQTIINPALVSDQLNSLITLAEQSGKEYYERWEIVNSYSGCMLGNPAISVLADAYMKGIRSYDVDKAYQYALNSSAKFGNAPLGYTAAPFSVSSTLEYAYTDWCIAQMARELGKEEDAKVFFQKGQAYHNVFDPEKGWFRPRLENGSWEPWPERGRLEEGYGCVESNLYQQGWFVPHDVEGMVKLMGGKEKVIADLTYFFEHTPVHMLWNDYYNHSNEPVHLVPFLFNQLGVPQLTQKWTRFICKNAYKNGVEGLVGNEDVGQMSAWYVLAAAGIHPSCPGNTRQEITSPVFDRIEFKLDSAYYPGKKFTIVTHNNSPENIYIQKTLLNGKEYPYCFIDFADIAAGGTLELFMGKEPLAICISPTKKL